MKKYILFLVLAFVANYTSISQISLLDNITTKNHSIVCIAYSPEGSCYATSGYEQTIIIRNTRGEIIKRLQGYKDMVKTLAFSHDGKFLVGGGDKKIVFVWNVETGALNYSLKGHTKEIKALAINNEGVIASGSDDKTIKLWNISNGVEIKALESHTGEITDLCFNGEGTQLASTSTDYSIKVWDGKTGALLKTLKDTDKKALELTAVAFSPNGRIIAAANSNMKIALWNAKTGLKQKEYAFDEGVIHTLQFSPDNLFLGSGGSTKKFTIWSLETGNSVYEAEESSGEIYALAFSPDGEKLLLADFTNELYIYDIKALGIPATLAGMNKASDEVVTKTPAKVAAIYFPKSEFDINIPEKCKTKNSNRYALVIGNEDYSSFQTGLTSEVNVDFALNDAIIFSNYARNVFCVPDENIILLKNAKAIEMQRAIEKISLLTELSGGKAEIIFYYAGHGFPDELTKEAYIMPVDVSGNDLRFAVNIKELYEKLSQYPSQRVTIFLDACFSGGARNAGLLAARGVKIVPKDESLLGNLVVYSASSGQESSLPYRDKEHGMFTYMLLKKLQDTKGEVTYDEMGEYLKVEVAKKSILINNKPQNPQVNISPAIQSDWKAWEF